MLSRRVSVCAFPPQDIYIYIYIFINADIGARVAISVAAATPLISFDSGVKRRTIFRTADSNQARGVLRKDVLHDQGGVGENVTGGKGEAYSCRAYCPGGRAAGTRVSREMPSSPELPLLSLTASSAFKCPPPAVSPPI